jgi:hypothetical protein
MKKSMLVLAALTTMGTGIYQEGIRKVSPMRTARSGTAMPRDTSNGNRLTKCAKRRKRRTPIKGPSPQKSLAGVAMNSLLAGKPEQLKETVLDFYQFCFVQKTAESCV